MSRFRDRIADGYHAVLGVSATGVIHAVSSRQGPGPEWIGGPTACGLFVSHWQIYFNRNNKAWPYGEAWPSGPTCRKCMQLAAGKDWSPFWEMSKGLSLREELECLNSGHD